MPIESILVSAAVAALFATFAGVLLWGDRRTRPARPRLVAATKRRSF
jgi:hypothetical protein